MRHLRPRRQNGPHVGRRVHPYHTCLALPSHHQDAGFTTSAELYGRTVASRRATSRCTKAVRMTDVDSLKVPDARRCSHDPAIHRPRARSSRVQHVARRVPRETRATDDDLMDRTVTTCTLSGPADSNIVRGRLYELTATASSPVKADTTVEILRDTAASDAGADDYNRRVDSDRGGRDHGDHHADGGRRRPAGRRRRHQPGGGAGAPRVCRRRGDRRADVHHLGRGGRRPCGRCCSERCCCGVARCGRAAGTTVDVSSCCAALRRRGSGAWWPFIAFAAKSSPMAWRMRSILSRRRDGPAQAPRGCGRGDDARWRASPRQRPVSWGCSVPLPDWAPRVRCRAQRGNGPAHTARAADPRWTGEAGYHIRPPPVLFRKVVQRERGVATR